jgi:hypothetical protein
MQNVEIGTVCSSRAATTETHEIPQPDSIFGDAESVKILMDFGRIRFGEEFVVSTLGNVPLLQRTLSGFRLLRTPRFADNSSRNRPRRLQRLQPESDPRQRGAAALMIPGFREGE